MNAKEKIEHFYIKLTSQKRNLFLLGVTITIVVTLSEVLKWKQRIFIVYQNATLDYWKNIIPYGSAWAIERGPDEFLYGPLFTILFAPFAYLPTWLGPFIWNLFSFTIFFLSVFKLPQQFNYKKKCKIFLYSLLVLANNLMYYQYNVIVAGIFLLAFTYMESNKMVYAILLIGISGFTKIYGIFQYTILVLYKRFWKNSLFILIPISAILFLIPIIHLPKIGIFDLYKLWFHGLQYHSDSRTWQSIFYIKLLFQTPPRHAVIYQMGSFVLILLFGLLNLKRSRDFSYRAQTMGILMGWLIFFSSAPEIGTYLIAILGYLLWYYTIEKNKFDRILFILNFILLVVVPQDIICPRPVMKFIYYTLNLNLIIFGVSWVNMVLKTMIFHDKSSILSK
jgi:hypothetical protein